MNKRTIPLILVILIILNITNPLVFANNLTRILYDDDGITVMYMRKGELVEELYQSDIERSGGEDDKEHLDSVTVFDQSKYAPKIEGGLYYRTVGYHFALLDGDLIPVQEDGIILESETGKTVSEL